MERKWWSLLAVCLATFMLLLDITVVNVALPDIQKALNTDLTGLQWVVDAYTLTLAAFTLTMGALADRFGRRRLFLIGVGLFTLASLLCGLATSATFLHLARGLQGIGGAAIVLLVAFVLFEWRQEHAMFDLSLFRKPSFSGVSYGTFAIGAGMFAMFLYITIYMQSVIGMTPLQAGVRFLPLTLFAFIVPL